jgi:hypothetical protein
MPLLPPDFETVFDKKGCGTEPVRWASLGRCAFSYRSNTVGPTSAFAVPPAAAAAKARES